MSEGPQFEVRKATDVTHVIRWEEIPGLTGRTYAGLPLAVSRDERDAFERLTLVDRAHPVPDPPEFPADIVEGFHTLALLDAMSQLAVPFDPEATYAYNYGLDRVRWIRPVRIGDVLQSRFTVEDVRAKDGGWVVRQHCVVFVTSAEEPVMDAVWLAFVLRRPSR